VDRPRRDARPESSDFRGATVVITGAASGIGRATATAFAAAGARVVPIDIDPDGAAKTAADCGSDPSGVELGVDVADRDAVFRLAEQVLQRIGPVDVLVNNAGVGLTGRFLETSAEDWDWVLGVNLRGVIHGCQAFGPAMVQRRSGHVANISSVFGYTPRAQESAYVTTKAAVLALSQSLRADWAPSGVGVSAICPGLIATAIASNTRYLGERARPASVDKVQRLFSHGHPPDKVAGAVVSAVQRNRAVVPVGFEAHLGWVAHRLLPSRAASAIGRVNGL
jgi:NAD(P)-dependent dehydrogenase (short-subunit alcohol dehydrogenase family)